MNTHSIPIFDSLTHPTIEGNWLDGRYSDSNTVEALVREMEDGHVKWGLAVGMKGVGGYREDTYSDFVRSRSKSLLPVAFFDFDVIESDHDIVPYLRRLKTKGYTGIKIHPRLSSVTLDHWALPTIISEANGIGLGVLLCTYFFDRSPRAYKNNLPTLIELLGRVPDQKLMLVHGGGVQLLEMMEVARSFKSVLLDLSLTLCKYAGSSLDDDIRFLFGQFDRRTCIGSDSPEFSTRKMRERFEHFAAGIEEEKLSNIAHRNLLSFLGLDMMRTDRS